MSYRSPALTIARAVYPLDPVLMTGQKGINNAVSDEFIDDQELSDASNYVIDYENAGVLIKREGITKKHATDINSSITSIYGSGILANTGYVTANSAIWSLQGAEVHSGLTTMTDPSWATYTDGGGTRYDIVSDGTNKALKTANGTSFAALTSGLSFTSIAAYNNFLWGVTGNTLRWSDFGDDDVWDASNSLTFDLPPTALKRYRNYLYLFNEEEFFQIDAVSETSVSIVGRNYDEGCSSHRSVVVSPYGMFWWSKNGLIWLRGGAELINVSKRKIPTTVEGLNRAYFNRVHGIWNPKRERVEFWVFNGSATTVDYKIIYYPLQDAFFICRGAGVEMGASAVIVESGAPNVYVGSAASSLVYVYQQTGDTDDGVPIEGYLEYKRHTPYGVNAVKRMKIQTPQVFVVGDLAMTYSIYLNNDTAITKDWVLDASSSQGLILGTGVLGTATLGAGTDPREFPISRSFRYRKVKPRISDGTAYRSRVRGVSLDGYLLRA